VEWCRHRLSTWKRSIWSPPESITQRALARLKTCGSELGISDSIDWTRLCERAVHGIPVQQAARAAGIPCGTLRGIARLDANVWQYTEPLTRQRTRFSDCVHHGSPLIALSFTVQKLATDTKRASTSLKPFSPWVGRYLAKHPRIGTTGIAFLGFRPRQQWRRRPKGPATPSDYDTFVSSPRLKTLGLSTKVHGVSMKKRGAHRAAVESLQWLSATCDDLLILNQHIARSRLLVERRLGRSIWILERPTPKEIERLATCVLTRLGVYFKREPNQRSFRAVDEPRIRAALRTEART